MAKISVTVNTSKVEKSPATLEFWAQVMLTANPGSDTTTNAVRAALQKNPGYVDAFRKAGKESDVFELTREGEKGNTTGKYTRSQIAEKILVAANVAKWQGEIITPKDGGTGTDKGALEV